MKLESRQNSVHRLSEELAYEKPKKIPRIRSIHNPEIMTGIRSISESMNGSESGGDAGQILRDMFHGLPGIHPEDQLLDELPETNFLNTREFDIDHIEALDNEIQKMDERDKISTKSTEEHTVDCLANLRQVNFQADLKVNRQRIIGRNIPRVFVLCTGGTLTMVNTPKGYVSEKGVMKRLKIFRSLYDENFCE